MIKRVAVAFCLLVMTVALVSGCAKKQPPVPTQVPVVSNANTVWMNKVAAKPGESFALRVNITNVDTLAGAQVPIFFRSDNIKLICDSVSFAGGLCENFMFHDIKIPLTCPKCEAKYDMYDNPPKQPGLCDKDAEKLIQRDQVVFFMTIDTIDPKKDITPMYPGEGLLATVYFTVPQDTPTGIVKLTRGIIPNPNVSLVFSVWNTRGDDLTGQLRESEIEIK